MQANSEWMSISDMMAGLMMVFLLIAVLFMNEVQKEQKIIEGIVQDYQKEQKFIEEIVQGYQNVQQQLNKDLFEEFEHDLSKWDAEILPDNTIRFKSPDILFNTNSSEIKPFFKQVLNDFFPRYLSILTNKTYKDQIQEVRVEGHTSSIWKNATREKSYINNMFLSQNRARAVLGYAYNITQLTPDKRWLEKVFRANGMSFSKLIKNKNRENIQASQRVEFRVLTKSEEKIYKILDKLQK